MANQTSARGRSLIEAHESLRLDSYQDSKGVWTIGYGSTEGVHAGMTITQQQADERFAADLHTAETSVNCQVAVPLNQNQFDALVSLVFNIGAEAFEESTLLKLLNQSSYIGAAAQFPRWDMSGGEFVQGLLNRRIEERNLFMEVL